MLQKPIILQVLATFAGAGIPEIPNDKRRLPSALRVKAGSLHTDKGRMIILTALCTREGTPNKEMFRAQSNTDGDNNHHSETEFQPGFAILVSECVRFDPPAIPLLIIPQHMSPLDAKTGEKEAV